MRHSKAIIAMLVLILLGSGVAFAREIPAVVDVAWLEANLNNPKLVVLDVRKAEDYKAGHIPGAVSSFFGSWAVKKGPLNAEIPELEDLQELIQSAGIQAGSWVVVVESEGGPRFHFATRVAWTLAYAGLDHVTVLDGGYAAWTKAGKAVSTEMVKKPASKLTLNLRKEYIADKSYVLKTLNTLPYLDARSYDTYFGRAKLPFVAQEGHFPGAIAAPKEWMLDSEGKLVPKAKIEELLTALGLSANQEIVTYCDTGMGCSAWWWIIHEHLGWSKIRSYDGSSEELAKEPTVKFHKYVWR
jgi:thiosulfate/3-mercaptopyruvate sulfurtransferase